MSHKKTLTLVSLFIFINLQLKGQEITNDSPLTGSWEIVEFSWPDEGIFSSEDFLFLNNRWHFLSENKLALENEKGFLVLPYEQNNDSIKYNGGAGIIRNRKENHFTLSVSVKGIMIVAFFKRTLPLDLDKSNELLQLGIQKKIGAFRLDGFYYSEFSPSTVTFNTCLRFYADSTIIRCSSRRTLEEIATEFNKSMLNISGLSKDVEVENDRAFYSFEYNSKPKREGNVHFSIVNDTLYFKAEGYNFSREEPFQSKHTKTFFQSDNLAFWKGSFYAKEDRTPSFEEHFLLPSAAEDEVICSMGGQHPRFPGCEDLRDEDRTKTCSNGRFKKFIEANLVYPEEAKKHETEGLVLVNVIVEKDGRLTNPKISIDPGHGCGEAALKIIEKMNADGILWTPGKIDGRIVRMDYPLVMNFKFTPSEKRKLRRQQKN